MHKVPMVSVRGIICLFAYSETTVTVIAPVLQSLCAVVGFCKKAESFLYYNWILFLPVLPVYILVSPDLLFEY